jgi:hypothetical protein
VAVEATAYRTLPGLIPADRTNFTAYLQNHALCAADCSNSSACVGYTTDATPSNCWLYDSVKALVPSAPDAFHLKPVSLVHLTHMHAPEGPPV